MRLEEHEAHAKQMFGEPWTKVHKWLDEFMGTPPYGMRHRKLRHHLAGIEEVRALYGDEAAEVARQHIMDDLKTEGWYEGQPFPKDTRHFVDMGFF